MPMQPEEKRLDALRNLNILDTAPEEDFDELARLAALICKAPVALISLVDANRQWFKSKIGLKAQETAREVSFCTHAIQHKKVYLVEDATNDVRFRHNPLVTESPNIRFYAGAPLILEEGLHLGTLCVIDQKPRTLDAEQQEALSTLAKQVINLIRSRNLRETLELTTVRLKNLIDSQPAGILVEDRDRRVLLANRSIYLLFDFDPAKESLIGQTHEQWCRQVRSRMLDPAEFERLTLDILRNGAPTLHQQFQTKDDCWLERDYVPLSFNHTTDSHLWVYRDITERKRTDSLIEYQRAQMVESQRLSSLGEMAGGLAHEINNPMTVIYGRAEQLKELADARLLDQDQACKYTREIVDVSQRVMKIVRGLRAFARTGEADPLERTAVTAIISDTLEFCRQKIRECGIELRLPAIDSTMEIDCRPVQISQILLNLINNAYDAVSVLERRWIEIDAVPISNEILISVTDSGSGISAEIRDRLFMPFFTTKNSHQGTGLGLAISRRIAEDQGGTLHLDTNARHTRFVLRLPLKASTPARN